MKPLAKQIAHFFALVLVLPFVVLLRIQQAIQGSDQAIHSMTQLFACLPGITGSYLRNAILRFGLRRCAKTARVEYGVLFSKAGTILGEHCYVGPYCCIGLANIERDVLIASGVQVPSGNKVHGIDSLDAPIREQPGEIAKVTIGAGCWIGSNAVVMADVGCESIVAAGAVVTKPIPARSIAAGVPAKVIRSRDVS